ncbi:GGDEF domain-containing protein [Nitrincola sp. MINF-07-Sa-05]|uniref:GGDEF domain-containing protein n=1 Tax=Nitrincola salilacus TaxID=3400273 RepID=UPI003918570B
MLWVFIPMLISIGVFNGYRIYNDHRLMLNQIEQDVVGSLHLINEAITILESLFENRMSDGLDLFMEEYFQSGGDPGKIDLEDLSARLNDQMDLYIINAESVIQYTTLEQDLGLDMKNLGGFYDYLEQVRAAGAPQVDPISKETLTGLYRKYAYAPTPDKEWILELGLKNSVIASYLQALDPISVIERLVSNNSVLNGIRMIDKDGWEISMSTPSRVDDVIAERAFQVVEFSRVIEINQWDKTLRYIQISSDGDFKWGVLDQVIELDYNRSSLMSGIIANLLVTVFSILICLVLARRFRRVELELRQHAVYDVLTGIYNRRYGMNMLEREVIRSKRLNSPFCCLLIDIDHFKSINDNYGHDVGDQVLRRVSQELQKFIRPYDSFFRYGGEEFMILMPGLTLQEAYSCAERMREICESVKFSLSKTESDLSITFSAGVAQCQPNDTHKTLIKRADKALYEAKRSGRNRVLSSAA